MTQEWKISYDFTCDKVHIASPDRMLIISVPYEQFAPGARLAMAHHDNYIEGRKG